MRGHVKIQVVVAATETDGQENDDNPVWSDSKPKRTV